MTIKTDLGQGRCFVKGRTEEMEAHLRVFRWCISVHLCVVSNVSEEDQGQCLSVWCLHKKNPKNHEVIVVFVVCGCGASCGGASVAQVVVAERN